MLTINLSPVGESQIDLTSSISCSAFTDNKDSESDSQMTSSDFTNPLHHTTNIPPHLTPSSWEDLSSVPTHQGLSIEFVDNLLI